MVDLFDEVEEELRADKLKAAAGRVLPWVLGGIFGAVVIGGGFVGWNYWQDAKIAKASEAYEAIMTGSISDPEAGFKAFGDIAARAPAGYKTLALIHQGSIRLEQDKDKEAIELFDKAAKAAPGGKAGEVLADLARLKSAFAMMDDAPYAEVEARLKPLAEDGRPYRALAMEAWALSKLSNGKAKEARQDFLRLSADLAAPPSISARAKQSVDFIDSGSIDAVVAGMKAAKAAPPPNQMMGLPPEILEQLQAQGLQVQGAPPK